MVSWSPYDWKVFPLMLGPGPHLQGRERFGRGCVPRRKLEPQNFQNYWVDDRLRCSCECMNLCGVMIFLYRYPFLPRCHDWIWLMDACYINIMLDVIISRLRFFPWLATKALDNFTGDFHIVAVNSLSWPWQVNMLGCPHQLAYYQWSTSQVARNPSNSFNIIWNSSRFIQASSYFL